MERMGQIGTWVGIYDKAGIPIRIGDRLEFDPKEWGGPNSFIVEWDETECAVSGNGVVSEWPEYCIVIEPYGGW